MKYHKNESSTLEFKREFSKNNQIIKTAIGFCNLYGGRIIIGVDDDNNIIGLDEDFINQTLESLHKSIYEASKPPIIPKIYLQRITTKVILIIEIAEGMNKPYFLKSKGILKGTYVRMGRSTITANEELIDELKCQRNGNFNDEKAVYNADPKDLNKKQILNFLKSRKLGFKGAVTNKILIAYKLLTQNQTHCFPTIGALLLFGKNPQNYLTESFIICTHFSGNSGRKVISTVDCTGGLSQQIEEALQFIFSRLYKSFTINGIQRHEVLEVPEVAIREVLINAVVHRNYSINGPIKISIYEDRIEFFSPGIFPGPLDVNNLEAGITYIRNSVITRVFREEGTIEKLGSGFIALFTSYRKRKLDPPTIIEGLNFVKCILPRQRTPNSSLHNNRPVDEVEEVSAPFDITLNASTSNNLILGLFDDHEKVTMEMVLKKTDLARATAGRRLKKLLDDQKIVKIGTGRYCYYRKRSQ